jgi:hypothetical protein
MTVRVKVEGDDLDGFADAMLEDLEPRLVRAADRAASGMVGTIRRILSRRPAGEEILGPGAPPAYRSGELYNSIVAHPAKASGSAVEAEYGSPLEQAGPLEYGGTWDNGVYHGPHPFIRPAEDEMREEVERIVAEELGL